MTIRNFNSIYSSQSTYSSSVDTNQVSSTVWDNKFEGLTLFNSQVSIDKQLFVTGAVTVTGGSTFTGAVECKSTLKGPNEFIIDPSPYDEADIFGGTVIINGNLTVKGTTTTVNSTTLDIKDVNITLASGAASKLDANGAGLTIKLGDTNGLTNGVATLLYESSGDNFLLNKQIKLAADPADDNALTRRSYVNNGVNITNNTIGFEKLKGFKLKVISAAANSAPIDLTDIPPTTPCILYVLNKKSESVSAMLGDHTFVLYPGFSMHVYDGSVWSTEL